MIYNEVNKFFSRPVGQGKMKNAEYAQNTAHFYNEL